MISDATSLQRAKGQYFTPESLVKSFLNRILVYYRNINYNSRKVKVLDPAVGEGIFLEKLIPLIRPYIGSADFYGVDIDSKAVKKAEKKLIPLIESKTYNIMLKARNFFLEFPSKKYKNKFDLIIGNPPHAARYSKKEWKTIQNEILSIENPKLRLESSVYFVLSSFNLLRKGGLLGFILPKPIIYSKRWTEFRKLLLHRNNLLEVLDLGNQFSGQLQEQIGVIVQKKDPSFCYNTGFWCKNQQKLIGFQSISFSDAIRLDNLLVGITQVELAIIHRLTEKEYKFLDVAAFRGLNSKYRSVRGNVPIIEKSNIGDGFLLPPRHYVKTDVPRRIIQRQQQPKIIAHRIIGYKTQPAFKLNLKTFVDYKGEYITHETVINIIPNYSQDISLASIAGLIQSSFIEWWLRHAVYTKRFVTSKDFDSAYINRIRVPQTLGRKDIGYRSLIERLIKKGNLDQILQDANNQSNLDKLFTIGKIYQEFQKKGKCLKIKILHYLKSDFKTSNFNNKKNKEFYTFKWMIRQLNKNKDIIKDLDSINTQKM
ncbi:MAG: Eco57I restriction-modification methylase domain-containing protein, partial [Candidatus Hermodarchaeota archaeon]